MTARTKAKAKPTRGSSGSRSKRARTAGPAPALLPTLGPLVCRFMEENLVHGPGDLLGQPFRLHPVWRMILYRAYELHADGTRRWNHVLVGIAKGNVKSEMAAAVALTEAVGPVCFGGWKADGRPVGVPRVSPEIPIAAASFEQADLVFGSAREMIRHGPLNDFLEAFDTEILIRDRPGKLFRVAAVAGTNDGGRPTFAVRDEVHEWTGRKERVHLIIESNLKKRANTWGLDISTAGHDRASLLAKLYARGCRIAEGKEPDNGFLMLWFEAPKELDLLDAAQFAQACQAANPVRLDLAMLRNRFGTGTTPGTMAEHEFRRYHLNQWTVTAKVWLPKGAWAARARPEQPVAEGTPITVALDGMWDSSALALVGCTLTAPRHVFVLKTWIRPADEDEGAGAWRPPKLSDLREAIADVCSRYQVQHIALSASRFPELFTQLEGETLPVDSWLTHVTARIAPACKQFVDALTIDQDLTHDGSPVFADQVSTAEVHEDGHGRSWIARAPAAVAAVMAYDVAVRAPSDGTSVYDTRGILELG